MMVDSFAVTTAQLTRRFGNLTAVDRLELQVPLGSVYGFLGPNGAGKTTTIRMLLGLIRPDAGAVYLFGRPLQRERVALLRRVGALVETPSIYPHLTGRENLEVTRRLCGGSRAAIARALKTVNLEDAADRRAGQYSLGMQQRLGLALALLNDPALLILDEPTNGLDPAGIHEMRALISRLPREYGITVFLSSHLLSEVEQVATHIGILNEGRLIFQGTPEALHAEVEVRAALEVDQPQRATAVLTKAGWNVQGQDEHRLTVAVNGVSDVALLNGQLVRAGVNVYHLVLTQPSLEDLFLMLTTPAVNQSGQLAAAGNWS